MWNRSQFNGYHRRKWTLRREFKSPHGAVYIFQSTNNLEKGMNPNILSQALGKYGLSTNRLTLHLFNLCSNADSTPTLIFQRKHLDVTLSTCAQLHWKTYPRSVLSGPRSFKKLDDLSHCVATQFQGIGNLHIVLAIFMQCNNTSFKILREFFAMWCHVGTFQ